MKNSMVVRSALLVAGLIYFGLAEQAQARWHASVNCGGTTHNVQGNGRPPRTFVCPDGTKGKAVKVTSDSKGKGSGGSSSQGSSAPVQ